MVWLIFQKWCLDFSEFEQFTHVRLCAGYTSLTVMGSISVWLLSNFSGLDSTEQRNMLCVWSKASIEAKPVKLEIICTSRSVFCSLPSVTSKKSPNVYTSCPKMISLEKLKILTPLQKLPKSVKDLGNFIVAKGFEKLLKV